MHLLCFETDVLKWDKTTWKPLVFTHVKNITTDFTSGSWRKRLIVASVLLSMQICCIGIDVVLVKIWRKSLLASVAT